MVAATRPMPPDTRRCSPTAGDSLNSPRSSWNGTAPIDASSGAGTRSRANRPSTFGSAHRPRTPSGSRQSSPPSPGPSSPDATTYDPRAFPYGLTIRQRETLELPTRRAARCGLPSRRRCHVARHGTAPRPARRHAPRCDLTGFRIRGRPAYNRDCLPGAGFAYPTRAASHLAGADETATIIEQADLSDHLVHETLTSCGFAPTHAHPSGRRHQPHGITSDITSENRFTCRAGWMLRATGSISPARPHRLGDGSPHS